MQIVHRARLVARHASGDQQGCTRHPDGRVTTPDGFKEAFQQIVAGGWIGISVPTEFGGQGLPSVLTPLVNEFLGSANMAFAMYPGLTQGAIAALLVHGTPELHALYLPKMITGEWTGTMNLTEPQCGTDLGLIRTKAVKQPDGSYVIKKDTALLYSDATALKVPKGTPLRNETDPSSVRRIRVEMPISRLTSTNRKTQPAYG